MQTQMQRMSADPFFGVYVCVVTGTMLTFDGKQMLNENASVHCTNVEMFTRNVSASLSLSKNVTFEAIPTARKQTRKHCRNSIRTTI